MLKKSRDKKGLSQKAVADRLGYGSSQFISNFERGISSPPLNRMKVLVNLYQMSIEELMAAITLDQESMMAMTIKKVRKTLAGGR